MTTAKALRATGWLLAPGVAYLAFGTIYHLSNPAGSQHLVSYLGFLMVSVTCAMVLFGLAALIQQSAQK
ncbi:MAG: hypothetical protein JJ896_14415 [Rhodothermales bacterium]|nr:hypothetical protein [Rhodothermales bacterium]MBO6780844.1 hypothetical protein [Rhodothermales bacterium]